VPDDSRPTEPEPHHSKISIEKSIGSVGSWRNRGARERLKRENEQLNSPPRAARQEAPDAVLEGRTKTERLDGAWVAETVTNGRFVNAEGVTIDQQQPVTVTALVGLEC
jgi:hypothetical protein